MNETVSDQPQKNKAMISLNMMPGVCDYTLYVDSKKRQNFKIDLGMGQLSSLLLDTAKNNWNLNSWKCVDDKICCI